MHVFSAFIAGIIFFYLFNYFPFITVFVSLSLTAFLCWRKKYFFIPVLILGFVYAFLRYAPEQDISHLEKKQFIASGTFVSEPSKTQSDRFIQKFRVETVQDFGSEFSAEEIEEQEIALISDEQFDIESEYEAYLKIIGIPDHLNPGGGENNNIYATLISAEKIQESEKTALSFEIFNRARYKLNEFISENLNSDPGALVSAITTGKRTQISDELRNAFNSTGLAHILSVSGTHFGIFSVFLFGIFRLLINLLPYKVLNRLTLYLTPSQFTAILCAPFMIAYLGLSGASIPSIRSFIMICLFLVGLLISRKDFWLNSLFFAAFIIMIISPDSILSLSFQLSFIAVLFIGFSVGYGKEEKDNTSDARKKGTLKKFLKNSLFLTLSASLGTAPLVAFYFHYFSVISPISNLFITPLIGFILIPLSLSSSFIFILTGYYPFQQTIQFIADINVYLIKYLGSLPFADIKISAFPVILAVLFYVGFGIFFFIKKNKYLILIPSALLVVYIAAASVIPKNSIRVTYLDVGQGDASVVELPDKKILVTDTGKNGKEVASFLKYSGRKTIDALLLSHPHPDHTGGIDYLCRNFKVKEIWHNGKFSNPEIIPLHIKNKILERGDIYEGKGYKLYILHPYKEFYTSSGDEYNDENNNSIVLKIEGKTKSFLFTGDIETEAEEDVVYLGEWLRSNIIKIPHHGGKTSASEIFFDAVSPETAVISAGAKNPFGHPHDEMLENLEGVKILRTDIDGAVKITEKNDSLKIKTYADFQYQKTKSFREEIKNIKRLFTVW